MNTRFFSALAIAILFALLPVRAQAQDFRSGDLIVSAPWARATVGTSRPGAVFLAIRNGGKTTDSLVAAATPVAARVELHETRREGDVMKMVEVKSIDVGAGSNVALTPGGYHLMLEELRQPLSAGGRFPLRLTFRSGATIEVTVAVQSVGASGPGAAAPNMHHGH